MKNTIYILPILFCTNMVLGQTTNDCDTNPVSVEIETTLVTLDPPPPIDETDSDNDGVLDIHEPSGDCDEDGIENYLDPDSDNDGVIDGEDDCPCKPNPCSNDIRQTFFVHGFTGSSRSWGHVAAWMENTYPNINTYNEPYFESQISMPASVTAVKGDIEAQIDNINGFNKGNFVIAHSLGGMIMRNAESYFTNPDNLPFDGIITFGTAHDGVYAAETKTDRKEVYTNAIKYTCNKILDPVIYEFTPHMASTLAAGIGLMDTEKLCENIDEKIFKLIEKVQDAPIDEELTPQAAQSWPVNTTKHNIALYGIEDDNVNIENKVYDKHGNEIKHIEKVAYETLTPRFYGSMFNPPADFPLWSAGDADDKGLKFFAEAIVNFNSKRIIAKNSEKLFKGLSILNNSFLALAHLEKKKRKAYEGGLEWFRNINFMWKEIIGGLQQIEMTYEDEFCHCNYDYDNRRGDQHWYAEIVNNPGACEDLDYQTPFVNYDCAPIVITRIEAVDHPSDGFILQESAMNMPNATYKPIKMQGSNHFQMRNDKNTEAELTRIFRTGLGYTYYILEE